MDKDMHGALEVFSEVFSEFLRKPVEDNSGCQIARVIFRVKACVVKNQQSRRWTGDPALYA